MNQTQFGFTKQVVPLLAITQHALWQRLRPFVNKESYGETNQHRFELDSSTPPALVASALKMRVACVCCGKQMSPLRIRKAAAGRGRAGHMYLALTCPLHISMGCARGKAARNAAVQLAEEI